MRGVVFFSLAIVILAQSLPVLAADWQTPRRGSLLRQEFPELGDSVLANGDLVCEIVVSNEENSAVRQAAHFLAGDIESICGLRPQIVEQASGSVPAVHLATSGTSDADPEIADLISEVAWESYVINTELDQVWLIGSSFRGTAFAAYDFAERIGVDPLYHWSGYSPEQHNPLVIKRITIFQDEPAFRFRGFFHDDEDILPMPLDERGYPLQTGMIDTVWYERWFETALRLRCNMVAPWTRVERREEIQQLASRWGLIYTSHHYDILLSNPWGYDRFGLAKQRGVSGEYDWFGNRDGILDYWEGGVVENRQLECIWPVGMRGTRDTGYSWPENLSRIERAGIYSSAVSEQLEIVNAILEDDQPRWFHLTLYDEMLDYFRSGSLTVPDEVIIVWDDEGDGLMRGLPKPDDPGRHGVYFHLSFLGLSRTKQGPAHTVSPWRIARQFRQIVDSGATEMLMLNVSELRDVVMESRMVMDIGWEGAELTELPSAADDFIGWWSREYFPDCHPAVDKAYRSYYSLLPEWQYQWIGSEFCNSALEQLALRFAGQEYKMPDRDTLPVIYDRLYMYEASWPHFQEALDSLDASRRSFFYDNACLAILVDWQQTKAAKLLFEALEAPEMDDCLELCASAIEPLHQLEQQIKAGEQPPFEGWYNHTWIRYRSSVKNLHRPFQQLRNFLDTHGQRIDAEDRQD